MERPEASESGIVTELEHRRSRSMSNDEDVFSDSAVETEKKPKSRRLSQRMARNIKKQFKTHDKSRPRSHSPPSNRQRSDSLRSNPEEESSEGGGDPAFGRSKTEVVVGETKKHKSKLKPVAKAAVHAAKKLTGKKPGSSKSKDEDHSASSSRASTPTDLQATIIATTTTSVVGKTPVNTPVNATTIVDRLNIEKVMQQLPPTLAEGAAEDEPTLQELTAKGEPPPVLMSEAPANAVPTEDEALKLAEAMAIAVQKNPTKSQEEIRRMVYSQPEFKHLVPPGTIKSAGGSSDSTTKLLKKNFSNIKKQFTSGAGTAQKKILEMAETNYLGSGITSFMTSGATTTKPTTTTTNKAPGTEKSTEADSSVSSGLSAAGPSVATIPEETDSASGEIIKKATATDPAVTTAVPDEPAAPKPDPIPVIQQGPTPWQELPITITDIVWKRRSGFGKYSADAWERRRFVLQGNVLSYYRAKSDSLEPIDDDTDLNASMNLNASKSNSTKKQFFDYMEQVVKSTGLADLAVPAVADKSEEGKGSSARGYMDLIKENAVICATQGHSGAPSPFCLSIKVSGETKWKLCFASHRSQLQWMAAISDVIVRSSVDMYNVKLLTKADPSNHDPTQAFSPNVYEPPAGMGEEQQSSMEKSARSLEKRESEDKELMPQPPMQSGKRLWIMEPYIIRPQSDEDDDESYCSSSSAEDEAGLSVSTNKAGTAELIDDRDVWSLPEKNLFLAAAIVNFAILYARNSNMSVQGFWTVVTVANIALYTFLESKPRPEAVAAALAQSAVGKSPKKRRRKRKTGGLFGLESGGAIGEGSVGSKVKKEPFKPTAGTSAIRIAKPDDPNVNAKGEKFSAYCAVEGETLQVPRMVMPHQKARFRPRERSMSFLSAIFLSRPHGTQTWPQG